MDDLPEGPSARSHVVAHSAPHRISRMPGKAPRLSGDVDPLRPLANMAACARTDAAPAGRWSPAGLPGVCYTTLARSPGAGIATRKGPIQ